MEAAFTSRIETEVLPRDFLFEKFPTWTLPHWCIVVFAVSFLILAVLPEGRLNELTVPTGGENIRVARSLAFSGAFADPFATMKTGTTAHVAPAYPFLYSLALRMFGTGYVALLTLWALNVGFFSFQMGLLPLLSHRLHLGVLPGILAAALGTFSLYSPIDTRWESFLVGLLLLLTFFATERSFYRPSAAASVFAGIFWGVLILTNPVLGFLLLAWPLCWFFAQPKAERGKAARRVALIVALALLIASPWIVRNYARFGSFVFVRDNLGLELYTSNNSCAAPSISENIQSGCHARTHPNANGAVAAQLAAAGEVQFNHAKLHAASDWISSHPAAFLRLTLQRFRLFWFPHPERLWEGAPVWIVTLLSFAGLWVIAQKNVVAAWLMGSAWLLFPLVYYITQFEPRYRYPIYWTSLLPAGCALLEILRRLLGFSDPQRKSFPKSTAPETAQTQG